MNMWQIGYGGFGVLFTALAFLTGWAFFFGLISVLFLMMAIFGGNLFWTPGVIRCECWMCRKRWCWPVKKA